MRDQFRSLKSSADTSNNDKQCTTPGSCSNDDSNYAADQINRGGRNNGQQHEQQGGPKWLEELASESNTIQAQEDIVCQERLQAKSR